MEEVSKMTEAKEPASPGGVKPPSIRVGTSGWAYEEWHGPFYPPHLPTNQRLPFYREYFSTVEVNATFYRMPEVSTLAKWREQGGEGFSLAVKGSRQITHNLRLRDCEAAVTRLFERLDHLGPVMGPVLWQLPADLVRDDALLADFIAILPAHHQHAVEFANPGWLVDNTYSALDARGISTVAVSSFDMPPEKPLTGGMLYLRMHGLKNGEKHNYSKDELRPWVQWARGAAEGGGSGYVFFSNDHAARSAANALEFIRQLGPAATWSGLPEQEVPPGA